MTKNEFLKLSIKAELFRSRGWVLSFFGILSEGTNASIKSPTTFLSEPQTIKSLTYSVLKNKLYILINGNQEEITDFVFGKPLYGKDEKFDIDKDYLPIVKSKMITTYGILLMNLCIFWYPYKETVEYLNGYFKDSIPNSIAYNFLKEGNKLENPEMELYPATRLMVPKFILNHRKFENMVSFIQCCSQIGVPSASRKLITRNPEVYKLKEKLLPEYEGRLNDPAVVGELQAKLNEANKAYLKDDVSMGFLVTPKQLEMSYARVHSMYGAEPNFNDETKVSTMTKSLDDGWGIEDLPVGIDAIRLGVINRSVNTQLGGLVVKESSRIFQNFKLIKGDCGATEGAMLLVTKDNYKSYIGRYLVKKKQSLTEDELKGFTGKTIEIRSAGYCIEGGKGTGYCSTCIGDTITNSEVGLSAQCNTIGSVFLNLYMKLSHTTNIKLQPYNYMERIK